MVNNTVYVVFSEYQADTPTIEAVFATRAEAERHAAALRRSAARAGAAVWGACEEGRWTVDVVVEPAPMNPTAASRKRR
jgi:hypothetical protein